MARFIQCPGFPWEQHPSSASLEATIWCHKGQIAEFLLEDGDGLDVFEVTPTAAPVVNPGIMSGSYRYGGEHLSPLPDAARPSNPRHRWFSLRSDDYKGVVICAKKGGANGPDWAKSIRVIWSDQDPKIGPPSDGTSTKYPDGPQARPFVLGHINRALLWFGGESEAVMLWGAARLLGVERNQKSDGKPINCQNWPLAYAEHYLISRATVAEGGGLVGRQVNNVKARALVLGWDAIKAGYLLVRMGSVVYPATWKIKKDLESILKVGVCPASPPKIFSTAWGLAGCNDGLFELRNSDLPIRHVIV